MPFESNARLDIGADQDLMRPGGLGLTRRAMALCSFGPGDRAADIGCGAGSTVDFLRREVGLKAVGVDLKLKNSIADSNSSIFVRGDAERLPLASLSLSVIIAECTLSVINNKDSALSEFCRVMHSGGSLVITDVYARDPVAIDQIDELPFLMSDILTRKGLTEALNANGFITEIFEDHSHLLKEFVVRMIMKHGSLKPFWDCCNTTSKDLQQKMMSFKQAHPGYFMLIARKP
ncbi:MAG TPA: methyltransferase domain-containing protein [Dissulfurispiraceae bacterium]|nr:methyltransferase domain-containing protein [Dissulfurispiraceae bacterium]